MLRRESLTSSNSSQFSSLRRCSLPFGFCRAWYEGWWVRLRNQDANLIEQTTTGVFRAPHHPEEWPGMWVCLGRIMLSCLDSFPSPFWECVLFSNTSPSSENSRASHYSFQACMPPAGFKSCFMVLPSSSWRQDLTSLCVYSQLAASEVLIW